MLYVRFENKQANRYYRIILAKDMFDDWVLTKVWGGINQATGRITHLPCVTLDSAIQHVEHIIRMRIKRGYVIVDHKINEGMVQLPFDIMTGIKQMATCLQD